VEDCIRKGLLIAGDQLKNETQGSSLRALALRLSSLRFSIRQQDVLFAALDHWLGWIWSRPALLMMFVFVISTLSLFYFRASPLMSLGMTRGISNIPVAIYLWFVLGLYFVIVLHEIAHGTACRRLGGRVGEFGLMFYCGLLCAFVDTTSAWAFPRRSDRILVSFAGPLSTLVMGCIFLWGKATALYAGGYDTFALFELLAFLSLMLSLLNLLPVLEFDGYYILVDLLNHPNLKRKTAVYWSTLLKRKSVELPFREQIIYVFYGSGSLIILFLLVGVPLIEAARALAIGHVTIDALLPVLTTFLFFTQVLAQVGGHWFHYRRQLEINLKERKSQDFQW
jgi:putative peptide zinc metalloprotease protein